MVFKIIFRKFLQPLYLYHYKCLGEIFFSYVVLEIQKYNRLIRTQKKRQKSETDDHRNGSSGNNSSILTIHIPYQTERCCKDSWIFSINLFKCGTMELEKIP